MDEYRKELKAETRRINDYLANDTHLRPKPDNHGYKRVKILSLIAIRSRSVHVYDV